jgi:hypothetical protein
LQRLTLCIKPKLQPTTPGCGRPAGTSLRPKRQSAPTAGSSQDRPRGVIASVGVGDREPADCARRAGAAGGGDCAGTDAALSCCCAAASAACRCARCALTASSCCPFRISSVRPRHQVFAGAAAAAAAAEAVAVGTAAERGGHIDRDLPSATVASSAWARRPCAHTWPKAARQSAADGAYPATVPQAMVQRSSGCDKVPTAVALRLLAHRLSQANSNLPFRHLSQHP